MRYRGNKICPDEGTDRLKTQCTFVETVVWRRQNNEQLQTETGWWTQAWQTAADKCTAIISETHTHASWHQSALCRLTVFPASATDAVMMNIRVRRPAADLKALARGRRGPNGQGLRLKGPKQGKVLGEGAASCPPLQLGRLRERCKLPRRSGVV